MFAEIFFGKALRACSVHLYDNLKFLFIYVFLAYLRPSVRVYWGKKYKD